MFGNLPESRPRVHFRAGGSLASAAMHAVLIGGAVALTANAQVHAPDERIERIDPLMTAPPPPPVVESPRVASATSSSAPAPRGTPSIAVPLDIPTELPSIVLSTNAVHDNDFVAMNPRGRVDGVGVLPAGTGSASIAGVTFTAEQVDKPVILQPGSRPPEYPEALRQSGISGSVLAQFVVDSAGRVLDNTIKILQSDHDQFSGRVRAALPRMRFLPAEFHGRKVSQLVQLPFRFDITH